MSDTIVALSTPAGKGAIGIIRMSGPRARGIADQVFDKAGGGTVSSCDSHTLHVGMVKEGDRLIDEAVLCLMKGPRSYTGEDIVEIHCHGNPLVLDQALKACVAVGARPAEPGEFTKRAFLNGKLDLSQAEAVAEIVEAGSARALECALLQLRGEIGRRIKSLRSETMDLLAELEAALDFPEEEIEGVSRRKIACGLQRLKAVSDAMAASYGQGRLMRDGLHVAIVGRVNVGKSSIFNRLCRSDRAIVTPEKGTTRDAIEETVIIDGHAVVLSDTAGFGAENGIAAAESVKRSRKALDDAGMLVFVADSSEEWAERDRKIAAAVSGRRGILAYNKTDLESVVDKESPPGEIAAWPSCDISALTGAGMGTLRSLILSEGFGNGEAPDASEAIICNIRHAKLLEDAGSALERASDAAGRGMPEEIIALEVRSAADRLGEITGETANDELLERIFARFCIGK